jgi:hypothetical protein
MAYRVFPARVMVFVSGRGMGGRGEVLKFESSKVEENIQYPTRNDQCPRMGAASPSQGKFESWREKGDPCFTHVRQIPLNVAY